MAIKLQKLLLITILVIIFKMNNSITTSQLWDEIVNHSGLKYSKQADDVYKFFVSEKGVFQMNHYHEWGRLCIAYSLSKNYGKKLESAPDNGGKDVRNIGTLFQNESRLWFALIAEDYKNINSEDHKVKPQEILNRILALWHNGATLLKNRYDAIVGAYPDNAAEKFLEELAEAAFKNLNNLKNGNFVSEGNQRIDEKDIENIRSVSDSDIRKSISNIISKAVIDNFIEGVKFNRYLIKCPEATDIRILEKAQTDIATRLGIEIGHIAFKKAVGFSNSIYFEILRDKSTWTDLNLEKLEEAIINIPSDMVLPICLGTDFQGVAKFYDLFEAPHLLVGGTTGSGKSACVNAIILSLFKQTHTPIETVFIDPKRVEYSTYQNHSSIWSEVANYDSNNGIIVEADSSKNILAALIDEMESRYQFLEKQGKRNISELSTEIKPSYLIVFVDELADLVGQSSDIQPLLERLAQKGRASGIHLVLTTQRPDSKTFTGLLRTNVPARVALKVSKSSESGIILDESGAELLPTKGDRIVKWPNKTETLHGYNV